MNYKKEQHDLFLIMQVYGTLFSLINKLQIAGDSYLSGLTFRQYMTITAILHLPEDETTINNIARKLGTSKQNANRMVSSIEKLGVLSSFPSPKDKRAINVTLTEAGKEKVKTCAEQAIDFMADAFRGLDTSELNILWKLLQKVYEFDGEKQDGFEEVGRDFLDLPDQEKSKLSLEIIERFSKKRNHK